MNISNSYESDEYSGELGRLRECLQKHLGVSRQDLILLRANSYSSSIGWLSSWLLVKTDEIFYLNRSEIKPGDTLDIIDTKIKKQVLLWKLEKLGL